ncbi:MAG: alpha-2-macroglobulin, partial [Planctomycetota bacterium]
MRNALMCLVAVCFGSAGLMATTMEKPVADTRSEARKLFGENNFNDALKLYRELLSDKTNQGKDVAGDLRAANDCLSNLGLIHEADALIESAVQLHSDNAWLIAQAADLYGSLQKDGFVIAGKFERGGHRGGGQWASVAARDRVRSLQLYLQAIELSRRSDKATGDEIGTWWHSIASRIGPHGSGEAWKLQDLTDLTKLPDFEINEDGRWGGFGRGGWGVPSKGAPVDAEGNPVFHQRPGSWETAKSDGERWRWALAEVVKHQPARRSGIDVEWASFLQSQFGVGQSAIGGPPVILLGEDSGEGDESKPAAADLWAAHKLPDTSTIARLTTGVKRFALPDEFNHIAIVKAVIERNDGEKRNALELLISERMNRHQYAQAAELLHEVLKLSSDKNDRKTIQDRIDQIVKNWVQIESAPTSAAGKGATFELRFRNGNHVDFEAAPIRINALLEDVRKYLESKPKELDWQKTQINNIGWTLVQGDRKKYLDAPVAKWSIDLQPPASHFDARQTISTPLQKGGAYWITARMKDGNSSQALLWVADTVISTKRIEAGSMYFVADAASGSPIDRADLEFFGWRQEYRGPRDHVIFTSRFAARTNADGIYVPEPKDLDPQSQWVVMARTRDGRFAFDGFMGVFNPETLQPFSYAPLKVYAITDRPVYRPG